MSNTEPGDLAPTMEVAAPNLFAHFEAMVARFFKRDRPRAAAAEGAAGRVVDHVAEILGPSSNVAGRASRPC